MRKLPVEKQYRGDQSAHASTAIAGSHSGRPPATKANDNSDTQRTALSGKTLVEIIKTLGELRQKSGISGVATIVAFATCLHVAHALPETSPILRLLVAAGFALVVAGVTLMMILLQWFERWTNGRSTTLASPAPSSPPQKGGSTGS